MSSTTMILEDQPKIKINNIKINNVKINNEESQRVTKLRGEVATIMKQIRATTPRIPVSPDKAKDTEVWEGYFNGQSIKRVIIYLRSSGCFWAIKTKMGSPEFKAGCLDCEHSVAGTTFGTPISAASYIRQFVTEYEKFDFSRYPMLSIYNEGNFFNEREIPKEARREILRIIAADPNIKALIVESLPQFLTDEVLRESKEILGDKHVEIGIGVESANPLVRNLCVNKPFTLENFEKIAETVNRYFNLLAYVLVKPSFLTESEALEDAIKTVQYAFNVGVRVISIEPINIGEYAMSGALNRLGLYQPAWLWTVIEVAKVALNLGEVRIGGYQFAPKYEHFARNCEVCTMVVKDAIRQFNATNDPRYFQDLDCTCKADWKAELQKKAPPLMDRISYALAQLRVLYSSN
jgi:hypothetical protein